MSAAGPAAITVFDHRALRLRRARASRRSGFGFLFEAAEERLLDRLDDVRRPFGRALELCSREGGLGRALAASGVDSVALDPSAEYAARAAGPAVVALPELLPFADCSFDLVVGALALHWTNDLPGALLQLRRALKPDGLLLVSLLAGETLSELRGALLEAELAEEGGASPRVAPMADPRELAGLLQRAGFALPVVDSDRVTATYPDALALMRDLRGMGESNILLERRRGFTRRATLARAAALYAEAHAGPDGRIPAGFEIVTLTAWAPHPAQPKPLRPGSAARRLAEALGAEEQGTGEKAPRGPKSRE